MAVKENRVFYGLKNVYYSKITMGTNGKETYAQPVAIMGAVSLSVSSEGSINPFFADNTTYYSVASNKGYKGDLEVAMLPDSFRTEILGEVKGAKKVLTEKANAKGANFALLFEFEGDEKATRHVLYNCTAKRPDLGSETTGETIDIQKEKLEFEAFPNSAGSVKAKTTAETDLTTYNGWFGAVFVEGEV